MYDFAGLPANSRDCGWRKAAFAAAPQAKGGPQYNMLSPRRAAPSGEQHYSHVCSRARREAASQTRQYKPSCIMSSSSVSPTPAQSSSGLPSTAAVPAPPRQLGGCRHIAVGRCFLHITWVAVAIWQRVHLSEQEVLTAEAFSFNGSPEGEILTGASSAPSKRSTHNPTTTVEEEEADDRNSANAGQETTDDLADRTKLKEAELPTLEAEMRQRGGRRKRGGDGKTYVADVAAAGRPARLRPRGHNFKEARTSFNRPRRSRPVVLLGDLEEGGNAVDFRAAPPVLVIRVSARTRPTERKSRRIQSRFSSQFRALFIITVCLIVSVVASSALLKVSRRFKDNAMKVSRIEEFVLSRITRSTRMRMVYLTIAAALTQLSIADGIILAVGSVCALAAVGGFLAWFATQSLTGGFRSK